MAPERFQAHCRQDFFPQVSLIFLALPMDAAHSNTYRSKDKECVERFIKKNKDQRIGFRISFPSGREDKYGRD